MIRLLASALSIMVMAATATLATGQPYDFFETHDESARRIQSERYGDEKDRIRYGNLLRVEAPRPLGEAPPARFSDPRAGRNEDAIKLPRKCPPDQMMCR